MSCGQSNAILPADRCGNTIGIITTFRLTEAVQTEAAIILLIPDFVGFESTDTSKGYPKAASFITLDRKKGFSTQ
jgi:hypothetical protein